MDVIFDATNTTFHYNFAPMRLHRGISLHVKGWIHAIDILLIQLLAQQFHRFTKPLEVHDFSLPQEFDDVVDIRIIGQTQNIVIGDTGFLLRCQIFRQIRDWVALNLHTGSRPGKTGGSGGINTGRMVHEIGRKGGILNLRVFQVTGQLMDDGTDHFKVPQFFCANVRKQPLQFME